MSIDLIQDCGCVNKATYLLDFDYSWPDETPNAAVVTMVGPNSSDPGRVICQNRSSFDRTSVVGRSAYAKVNFFLTIQLPW